MMSVCVSVCMLCHCLHSFGIIKCTLIAAALPSKNQKSLYTKNIVIFVFLVSVLLSWHHERFSGLLCTGICFLLLSFAFCYLLKGGAGVWGGAGVLSGEVGSWGGGKVGRGEARVVTTTGRKPLVEHRLHKNNECRIIKTSTNVRSMWVI